MFNEYAKLYKLVNKWAAKADANPKAKVVVTRCAKKISALLDRAEQIEHMLNIPDGFVKDYR